MKKIFTLWAAALTCAAASAQATLPLPAADINEMWVMGDAVETGWSMGGTELYKSGDCIFDGNIVLRNGEFKFNYVKDNWDAWIWANAENQPATKDTPLQICLENPGGDYKFVNNAPGAYNLTVDLTALTLTITDAPAIYCVGDATPGGWNLGQAIKIDRTGAQTYTGQITLGAGEFKFLASDRNFASSIMAAEPATAIVLGEAMGVNLGGNDNKWICSEAGTYNVSVVLGEVSTLTITKDESVFTPTEIGMEGSDMLFTEVTKGVFKDCVEMPVGQFKVYATDGVATKWIKFTENGYEYVNAKDDANTLDFTETGLYQIAVDARSLKYSCALYTPWEKLYIVGNFNNWIPEECEAMTDGTFNWEGDIPAGSEVKFIGYPDYDHSEFELHPYVANEPLVDAQYCYNGGNDNKWVANETLKYNITVNPALQTVHVTTSEAALENVEININEEALYYNLHGQRITNPTHGIFIKKAGNQVSKISL